MPEILSEEWLGSAVGLLVRLVEAAGALVIFFGAATGFIVFCVSAAKHRDPARFSSVRLTLGRFLALGLEFQLGEEPP